MSDERGYSRTVVPLLFCLLGGPAIVLFLVLGSVFVENRTLRTHHIEEKLIDLHLDFPFRWFTHKTGLGP
jgi:hypothetical protein